MREPEVKPTRPRHRSRWISLLAVVLGAALVWALFRSLQETQDLDVVPSAPAVVGAAVLALGGLTAITIAWVALFDRGADRLLLADGVLLSQLGKYVPGAIWQPAGQIVMARQAGVPAKQAAAAVPTYLLGAAASATIVGTLLGVSDPHVLGGMSRLCLLGVAGAVLWHRRGLAIAAGLARRLWSRFPDVDDLPAQSAMMRSGGWHVLAMALQSAAFAVLATSVVPDTSLALAAGSFAAAWLVGFLAVPIPAGVGVREVVLVALLGGGSVSGAVVAAAVIHRVIMIAGEGTAILALRIPVRRHLRRLRTTSADPALNDPSVR